MTEFTSRTVGLLQRAGWHAKRSIDISRFEQVLEKKGCEVFPVVRDFLRQFGGLTIMVPYHVEIGSKLRIILNPGLVSERVARVFVDYWSSIVGKSLCPIGVLDNDILLMDSDGRVYEGFDAEFLDLVGESGTDAIENLLKGKDATFKKLTR